MWKSDFAAGFFNRTWIFAASAAGDILRAAFVWDSKTTSETSDTMDTDLDLHIYDPAGTLVAYSTSYDNSWEFVQFVAPSAGNYTIKVYGANVPTSLSGRYWAVAWTGYTTNSNCN
jgi:hypothetical protein